MSPQSILADAVSASKPLLARYLAGFTEENRTAQAPGLPNHVAWTLGHLALVINRVAEKIDSKPAPRSDFVPAADGPRPDGAFTPESVNFGSKPTPDPSAYPSLARCRQIYESACDRLASAARSAPDSKLAEVTPWGQTQATISEQLMRIVFHNGMHTGQIADLRRALGFKSIFS